jgi:hypothetical protein
MRSILEWFEGVLKACVCNEGPAGSARWAVPWAGEKAALGLRKPQDEVKRVPFVLAEALNSQNPTGRLQAQAVGSMFIG